MNTTQMILIAIVGTLVMVGGFSYMSRGMLYQLFQPTASKSVMKRANAPIDSSKWH